jgi:hypothetical protein
MTPSDLVTARLRHAAAVYRGDWDNVARWARIIWAHVGPQQPISKTTALDTGERRRRNRTGAMCSMCPRGRGKHPKVAVRSGLCALHLSRLAADE